MTKFYSCGEPCWQIGRVWYVRERLPIPGQPTAYWRNTRHWRYVAPSRQFKNQRDAEKLAERMNADWDRYERAMLERAA